MPIESGPQFLKEKYDLHNAPEVEAAAERTENRSGEELARDPDTLIQNYLDRFTEITKRTDPEKRERGIEALKQVLLDKFVTKYEDIPESFWQLQERVARERGQGGDWASANPEQLEQLKQQTAEAMISDQKASLEQWIDYFASEDSKYLPDYMKYWVFRSVVGLQEYDKENHKFPNRSRGTLKQFPDINQEALAYVTDALIKHFNGQKPEYEYDIQPEDRQRFEQFLAAQNFAKMYGWGIEQINPISEELLQVTDGQWVKFDQGSDSHDLTSSIRGRSTGWCTAGEQTAKSQLEAGDFYVFYSNNEEGNPTVPRIAIRMEDDKIAEVRGVAYKQNLDPYMGPILEEKLNEFPDKKRYLKKEHDMAALTAIEKRVKAGEELNEHDLEFLWEVNAPIQGFGYKRDPRIAELRAMRDELADFEALNPPYRTFKDKLGNGQPASQEELVWLYGLDKPVAGQFGRTILSHVVYERGRRNVEADMPIIFGCEPNQIARSIHEVNENTKAYVGPLVEEIQNHRTGQRELNPEYRGIFQKLANLEHVYTNFPEGHIRQSELQIGGMSPEQLKQAMRSENINISDYAEDMMGKPEFATAAEQELINLVRLKVGDIWKNGNPTTDQLYGRIQELGLELCPSEAGPHQRLADQDQPLGDWYRIGMKQITDRRGFPNVFRLELSDDGLWLSDSWARPGGTWEHDILFVFRLRKASPET